MNQKQIVQEIVEAVINATEEDGQKVLDRIISSEGYLRLQRIWRQCKSEHPELPRAQLLQLVYKLLQEEWDCERENIKNEVSHQRRS